MNYLEAKAELLVYMHNLPKLAGGESWNVGECRRLRAKSKLKPMSSNLFGMADVAAQLGKSVRWLQRFLRDHPCGRKAGRTRVFTPFDISQLIAELPVERSSPCRLSYDRPGKAGRPIIESEAGTSGSAWNEVVKLLTETKRENSSSNGRKKSNVVALRRRKNRGP